MTIRVLLVDDHLLFLEALQVRLSREQDFMPVCVATSVNEAVTVAGRQLPDLAVLDLAIGRDSGVELAKRLREMVPTCRVLILSATGSPTIVVDALRAGVRAWLPKTIETRALVAAMHGVLRGEAILSPALLGAVLDELWLDEREGASDSFRHLTEREREVLQFLVDGMSGTEIARRWGVSPNTVRKHTQNLFAKLDAHSTLEAVALGLKGGLRVSTK